MIDGENVKGIVANSIQGNWETQHIRVPGAVAYLVSLMGFGVTWEIHLWYVCEDMSREV